MSFSCNYLLHNQQQYLDLKIALEKVARFYQVSLDELENDTLNILPGVDVLSHESLQKVAEIVTTFSLPPFRHLSMARSPDSAAIYVKVAFSALTEMHLKVTSYVL